MPNHDAALTPTPEHRRAAAGQFERAKQVIATGSYDYGIQLLLMCCKLDPANLAYRQELRQTEKAKYKNNLRGSRFAVLTTWTTKAKLKAARQTRDYLKVLEYGEAVLVRNPWDIGTQMDMADAARALGLLDLAVWILEHARQKDPRDPPVNRALARLYEQRGNFSQAIALWELVRKAVPQDAEAQHKAKDLAASDTIARGHYEESVQRGPADEAEGADDDEDKETEKGPPSPYRAPRGAEVGGDRTSREVATLRARLEADPTHAPTYLHLAGVLRRAGQLEEAANVLRRGLGPTGNHFELGLELAELEIEPFRQNLVITEGKLTEHAEDGELRKIRIRLLKEINTREMELFRQKADRYPTEQIHRLELGIRLLRAGQVDEAIRELQAARADPRLHWRALLYLGYSFKSRNNWRLAQRNFEEALHHLPPGEDTSRKEILFQLAQGLAEAGELSRAVDLGCELANLDFSYRDIGRLLDEWQSKLQKA